jgi:hypothetical protein
LETPFSTSASTTGRRTLSSVTATPFTSKMPSRTSPNISSIGTTLKRASPSLDAALSSLFASRRGKADLSSFAFPFFFPSAGLCRMALEYNLRLLYKKDFEEIFNEEQAVPEFSDLLKRMKVVNDEGSSEMTGDQWEACSQSSVLFLSLSLGVSFS